MMEKNLEFLRWLSQIRLPFLDTLMLLLTELGSEIIILGVVCVLYWCVNKNAAYRLGTVFFVSGILVQGLKVSFHIPRPWVLDPTFEPVAKAKPGASGYSFPSGHTQGGAALYGTGALVLKKAWMKTVCIVLMLLVAFTRLYLGVHTPLDVVTSLAVTGLCVFGVNKLFDLLEKDYSHDLVFCIALASIAILLCVYSFILASCGVIEWEQINDCFKSGGAGSAFALGWYFERSKLKFSEKTPKLWQQLVKILVGIAVAFAFKELPKLIAEGNLAVDFIRYFLTVSWVMLVFPWLFSKVFCKKGEQ